MIEVFLQHRREVVTRRTVFELRKARERGHVLEGLAVALANIDDFIAIIRRPRLPSAKALMAVVGQQAGARDAGPHARRRRVVADDYRPEGLEREFGMQGDGLYRLSETRPRKSCRCACSA
jgi:DNA gyrase subunit A